MEHGHRRQAGQRCVDECGMKVLGRGWHCALLDLAAQRLVHHCECECVGFLQLVLDELVEVC